MEFEILIIKEMFFECVSSIGSSELVNVVILFLSLL